MSIKILHTSDWHLGKKLFQVDRLEEQEKFLNWLLEEISNKKITHLIISGDIFDTPNPPDRALSLYFRFLKDLGPKNIKTFIIAGNHDSGRFIDAPKEFLKENEIYIIGKLIPKDFENTVDQFSFQLNENYQLNALPYFRTKDIQDLPWYERPEEIDTESSKQSLLQALKVLIDKITNKEKKNILMAHHLFGSFFSSESEQSLNLSGVNSIPLELFKDHYEYLALGHIHKPQIVHKENPLAIYSGSPLPFRFSEIHQKKYSLIEINQDNEMLQSWIEIPIFRQMIRISTDQEKWKEDILDKIDVKNINEGALDILLELEIKLSKSKLGIKREVLDFLSLYPITIITLKISLPENQNLDDDHKKEEVLNQGIDDLFIHYYKEIYPEQEPPEQIVQTFNKVHLINKGLLQEDNE